MVASQGYGRLCACMPLQIKTRQRRGHAWLSASQDYLYQVMTQAGSGSLDESDRQVN